MSSRNAHQDSDLDAALTEVGRLTRDDRHVRGSFGGRYGPYRVCKVPGLIEADEPYWTVVG